MGAGTPRGQAATEEGPGGEEDESRIVDVTDEVAGGGNGVEGASAAAAAEGGGKGAAEKADWAGAEKGKKRPMLLEISNSIIDELED